MTGTKSPCAECAQRRKGFLSRLPCAIRDTVDCVMEPNPCTKGTVLVRAGQPPRHLHAIQEGLAKVVAEGPHGQPRIVDLLGPGDLAGLEGAFDRPAPYDIVAITPMTTCRSPSTVFHELMRRDHRVSEALVHHLLCVQHRSGERLRSMGVSTAIERLAAYFVDGPLPQVEPGRLRIPMQRRELAALLGTTPETVARSLHTLAEEGLIQVEGHEVRILDAEGLILRADGDMCPPEAGDDEG